MSTQKKVTYQMIEEAAEALKGTAELTPVVSATRLHPNIFFKAENLQKTGSFKIRGAFNKIRTLTEEEGSHGVIACSAGNHAQGVALSAARRGIRSVVCMPANAPLLKVNATKVYGAEVVLVPGCYDDAAEEAEKLSREKGMVLVHPFDDPYVIAGQGTIGKEIVEQMPDVEQVIVSVGGGGLISGVALAIKTLKPSCRVIGVQTDGVASMYGSVGMGERITVMDNPTIADGIHVLTPGQLTFEMVNEYVDDIVTVTEEEISAAIVSLLEGPKIVAEGAGAATAAAFLSRRVDTTKKTVCIISGGNVDISTLTLIVAKGLHKLDRLTTLEMDLPDSTKSLAIVMEVIADSGALLIDMQRESDLHSRNINSCHIKFTVETTGREQLLKLKDALGIRD